MKKPVGKTLNIEAEFQSWLNSHTRSMNRREYREVLDAIEEECKSRLQCLDEEDALASGVQ